MNDPLTENDIQYLEGAQRGAILTGVEAQKYAAEIRQLRRELAEAKGMIAAHEKCRDLMNKGFESVCDLQSELKQENRKLKEQVDMLNGVMAVTEKLHIEKNRDLEAQSSRILTLEQQLTNAIRERDVLQGKLLIAESYIQSQGESK